MFDKIKEKTDELVKKTLSYDDSHEFKPILSEIEDSPVSPIGRFTFWTIVVLMVFTALWLVIGKVDIVVSARGIVIPDGESKVIQPLETGVITKISVKEGDFVTKGQILMEIDPSTTAPELESTQKNLEDTLEEIKRLHSSASGQGFETSNNIQNTIYQSNTAAYQNQLNVKRLELTKIDEELKATKAEKTTKQELLESYQNKEQRLKNVLDVIAYDEYEETVNQVKTLKTDITKLNHKLNELSSQKSQVHSEIAYIQQNYKVENLEKLVEKNKQANSLKAEADTIIFKNTKQTITSPCDGYVDKIFIHTIGGVVTPAQELFNITPIDIPLLLKVNVLNQDIGFVKEGMNTSVKIDTFNFQKYGMLEGSVKTVSKNSIVDKDLGQIYEVYITPLTQTLKVEGKDEHIRTGMTLTAEINVGKRRIIEFFIYPLIKYLDEGMSVR